MKASKIIGIILTIGAFVVLALFLFKIFSSEQPISIDITNPEWIGVFISAFFELIGLALIFLTKEQLPPPQSTNVEPAKPVVEIGTYNEKVEINHPEEVVFGQQVKHIYYGDKQNGDEDK